MTRAATQAEQFDHDRGYRDCPTIPLVFDKNAAVAALIGHCEAIAASGQLAAPSEKSLRLLIAWTLTAFDMPSKAERVTS
jgi:hypothetical protein